MKLVVCAGVLALMASGCGFSDIEAKRDDADRIADASANAAAGGLAAGTLGLSVTIEKTRLPLRGVREGFTTPEVAVPVRVDLRRARSVTYLPTPSVTPQPAQVYDEGLLFQHVANSTRARKWVAYDIGAAYDQREALEGDAFGNSVLNPAYLLTLLAGPLTGSVERVGAASVAGVTTTHFKANFDATKAVDDLDDTRREALLAALALMDVSPESVKGEVWLDRDGVARKVVMRLRQKLTRRDIIVLNLKLTLAKLQQPGKVDAPADDEYSRTDDIGLIARGLEGLLQQFTPGPGGRGGPGGGPVVPGSPGSGPSIPVESENAP